MKDDDKKHSDAALQDLKKLTSEASSYWDKACPYIAKVTGIMIPRSVCPVCCSGK